MRGFSVSTVEGHWRSRTKHFLAVCARSRAVDRLTFPSRTRERICCLTTSGITVFGASRGNVVDSGASSRSEKAHAGRLMSIRA